MSFANLADGGIDALFCTPVDDYRCTFRRQATGDRETNSGSGTCYESFLAFKLQIHKSLPVIFPRCSVNAECSVKILRSEDPSYIEHQQNQKSRRDAGATKGNGTTLTNVMGLSALRWTRGIWSSARGG